VNVVNGVRNCSFIVAGDPAQLTGGYLYDARIVDGLRGRGWTVDVIALDGCFPAPDAVARAAFGAALARIPTGTLVVIDGLALGGLPEVAAAQRGRLRMVALVHHPLADERGLDEAQRVHFERSEASALNAVDRIITTSAFTARRLGDFDLAPVPIEVVEPGTDSAPLAAADGHQLCQPPRLLCVASVTPRKGHDVLVAALAGVRELRWQCDCIGSLERDRDHAARVAELIHAHGLDRRIRLHGEQGADALHTAYAHADLFVLPSRYEGYGMVIGEALARGLPVVTTTGGALAETVPADAGLLVPADDAVALGAALRRVLEQPELQRALRVGARRARAVLRSWPEAVAGFERVLEACAAGDHFGVNPGINPGADHSGDLSDDGGDTVRPAGAHAEAVFSADWLALRAAADARARDGGLSARARQWLSVRKRPRTPLRLLDLGTGSGANPAFLACRLPGPQAWTLLDHDPALLARAFARGAQWRDQDGRAVEVRTVRADLGELGVADLAGFDLVTASALIDLVDAGWTERFARACREVGAAVLITLSVDGTWALTGADADEDDDFVRTAFNAHQRGDKGVGGALGPDAAPVLAAALGALGYEVQLAPSRWRLHMAAADERALALVLMEGWRDAACAQCPTAAARIEAWYQRRRRDMDKTALVVEVGHFDLLALPPGEECAGGAQ